MKVALQPVTRHNLAALLALDAGDGGKQVAANVRSMAQAAVYAEAWPRAIVVDGEDAPAGFVMLYDPTLASEPEDTHFFLWRLMVDRTRQGQGIGAAAVRALLEHVRSRPGARELGVSYVDGQERLRRFYESLGFRPNGDVEDGEIVMVLAL